MITLYELLNHTTAERFTVIYRSKKIEMNIDNFMNFMHDYGGALVWIFSAVGKNALEIIIKDA